MCLLKVVVSRDFWHFLLYPTWAPDKHAKMVLLKESLSWRYSRNKWLHSDYHCAELDSALTNTARSHKNKFAEIHNWLTLRGVEFFELATEILLENEKVSKTVFVCLKYMSHQKNALAWSPLKCTAQIFEIFCCLDSIGDLTKLFRYQKFVLLR